MNPTTEDEIIDNFKTYSENLIPEIIENSNFSFGTIHGILQK